MSQTIVNATYSGHFNKFTGNWNQVITHSSEGGGNGEIGGIKLRHPAYGDYWDEIGIGFAQFDTSGLPDNCTIHSAYFRCYFTLNNKSISGLGAALSFMTVGGIYNEAVDEFYSGNILGDPVEGYSSGVRNFPLSSPNSQISKVGWTKLHFGTGNVMSRISPGPAAPSNSDDFNVGGYDHGVQPAALVIVWTTPAVVTNGGASNVEHNSALLSGNVTDVGGGTVSERGFCWGLSVDPTIADSKASSPGQGGAFSVSATGLTKNTTYHIRPYVITENSIQYGPDSTFITDVEPTVVSVSITDLNVNQAVANGNVTSDGRGTVSERGFVLNKTGTPTIADTMIAYVSGGTGTYAITFPNLMPGTKYFVRPYAINGAGLAYGDEMTFITPGSALFMMMA